MSPMSRRRRPFGTTTIVEKEEVVRLNLILVLLMSNSLFGLSLAVLKFESKVPRST